MKKIFEWFKSLFCTKKKRGLNRLGWKRDLPDPRDHKYKITPPHLRQELPEIVDLRYKCPPVYDQGEIGSCTANALGGAFQFEQISQKITDFVPSRLFIYYNTRSLEDTIRTDSGATLRNTMKTMVNEGVCPETMWKYSKPFTKKPDEMCYRIAKDNQVLEYLRITHNLYDIKSCLAEGHTVAFGMMLYDSFMSDGVAASGKVYMPNISRERSIGGHAVLAVGYDDTKKYLIVRNSWGRGWGDKGYFYLPYDYITTPNMCADFWTIKLVEDSLFPVDDEPLKTKQKLRFKKRKVE